MNADGIILKLSRRDFLEMCPAAGAGLALAVYLGNPLTTATADTPPFAPNAFLSIDTAGKVTIWVARSEMGQGVRTALPMIVAEELETDWKDVSVQQAPFDPKYGEQGTGGSTSVRTSWEMLRKAGATGREMLIETFAKKNHVAKDECVAADSVVVHKASGRRATYAELAGAAARLPLPKDVSLKDPKDFRLIGKPLPRTDIPSKVVGGAQFGIDVRVPGMLFATVVRCPVFGGKVASFDGTEAKAVAGVKNVVQLRSGVAVVAENTWAALKGRESLEVKWDQGPNASESADGLRRQFEQLVGKPQKAYRNDKDVEAALSKASKRVDAVYELPFLAHAPMEPPNCTAWVQKDRCEVWAPTQSPEVVHSAAKRITGLPDSAIRVNVTFLGGGFGRRWFPAEVDDAIETSKLVSAPVQVLWTREDDIQHDFYRPASFHRLSGGLDERGWPVAWLHRFASTSIMGSFQPDSKNPEAIELGGAVDFPYAVPNVRVEYVPATSAAPRGWLRSVSHTFNAFVVQCFVDELAAAAGKDPYEYRKYLLREPRKIPGREPDDPVLDTERLLTVLELAATKAGWGKPLPKGKGRGMAHHFSFYSYVAEVAEVSVEPDGAVRVERVICAVDCGRVVNPDILKAQVESGVVYGLSALLEGEITLDHGRVQQSNFNDYDVLHIAAMPLVEVHIVPSDAPPTGIGEPATPPIAPAVANAIYAATGRRFRRLPIRAEDVKA